LKQSRNFVDSCSKTFSNYRWGYGGSENQQICLDYGYAICGIEFLVSLKIFCFLFSCFNPDQRS
jgi:hypothetical protein